MKLAVVMPCQKELHVPLNADLWSTHMWVLHPSGFGVIPLYEEGWREVQEHGGYDIVAFLHDDLEIYEKGWDARVLKEFEDPKVGLVGFGGALVHGDPNIYKKSYSHLQLGRSFYLSNTKDAELHGERYTGECDVAVLDGFSLILRRELLETMGGWLPDKWPPHHCYDYRAACEAHRHGYKVRLVGMECHHQGGMTATQGEYQDWCRRTKWGSDSQMHIIGHQMIYDEYKDVLPWDERK